MYMEKHGYLIAATVLAKGFILQHNNENAVHHFISNFFLFYGFFSYCKGAIYS